MKYKSIVATARGGPEVLQIVEQDLRPPSPGEARIKILAAPVCQDDVAVRRGTRPWLEKTPFVPGYSCMGMVDALGEGVTNIAVGDRVAALTNFGSHAEYLYWKADQLIQVPETLELASAAVLILNYLVPMQVMHSVVQVKPGQTVLVVGASGGTGTAFLDLCRAAGLKTYGIASGAKQEILEHFGALPIDYKTQDFLQILNDREPDGIDYVFNGMGEEYFTPGIKVLKRGGVLVHYGGPTSMASFRRLVIKFIYYNLLPNGKRIKGYGTHTGDINKFAGDWNRLFEMLRAETIQPVIMQTFPLLEAKAANELLESGDVVGNLVLLAPELL
jgi:NADPH:quinone reductase-like Zn-dependent oxidoreductase